MKILLTILVVGILTLLSVDVFILPRTRKQTILEPVEPVAPVQALPISREYFYSPLS